MRNILPLQANTMADRKPRWRHSSHAVAGLTILILQFALLSYSFPLSELFSTLPLTAVDHAFHQYQTLLSLDLAKQGQIVGYDPHFSAGYVGGVTLDASAHLPTLAVWAMESFLNPIATYKVYVFIAALIATLCLPLAACILNLNKLTTWCASILGLLLWWASAFHWYHTVGMVSYVLVAYLSIPYCAALIRILRTEHRWSHSILLGLCGSGAFFIHPFFPIAITIFVVMLHVFYRNEYRLKRTILPLTIIAIIAVLPNLIWIATMISSPSFAGTAAQPYQKVVDVKILWGELIGLWHAPAMGAKIYPLLVILAAIAGWREAGARQLVARIFLAEWGVLVVFAAFGAALPGLGALQPNRFSMLGYLFLVIPASMGLVSLLRLAITKRPHGYPLAILLCLMPLAALVGKEFTHEISTAPTGRYGKPPPEVTGLGENNQALLHWITENTSQDGRILFETSLARVHDGAHIAGLLAYLSKREFIGGPYPYMFFADFWDEHVFGKKIQSIDQSEFSDYLGTYNIGWIIAHSPQSIEYLDKNTGIKYITQIGPVRIYQANRPLTYVLAGLGKVSNQGYSLSVHVPEPGEPVTLSYHYTKNLHSDDGSDITPIYLVDDPQPFIRLTPRHSTVILCDTQTCPTKEINHTPNIEQ